MNIPGFGIFLDIYNVLTYNSMTGQLESGGTAVTGATSYTIAQFLLLDVADYANYTILVSDIPTAHSSVNGVLVRANAAGTGWIWIETPSFTRATVPTAAQASGWRIFVSDIGARGSFWYSNGTRYLLDQPFVVLSSITSSLVMSPTPTAFAVAKQVTVPLIDGKSIWGDGDIMQIDQYAEKTGTADILNSAVYVGPSVLAKDAAESTGSNVSLGNFAPAAGQYGVSVSRKILRKSATSLRLMGPTQVAGDGGNAAAVSADVTVSSLDSATAYIDAALKLSTSTGDSALTLATHTVTLIQSGAA